MMFPSLAMLRLKTLALLAGVVLIAAQTLELQHLHCEAEEAGCALCATTLYDDAVPATAAVVVFRTEAVPAPAGREAPALLSPTGYPFRARAPPARSL